MVVHDDKTDKSEPKKEPREPKHKKSNKKKKKHQGDRELAGGLTAASNELNAMPGPGNENGAVDDLTETLATAALDDRVSVEASADCTSPTSSTSTSTIRPPQSPPIICRFPPCGQPCLTTTASTHICPNCGPLSPVRYCSKQHIYEDLRRHYLAECRPLATIGITPTITPDLGLTTLPLRPYLHPTPGITPTIERHRQAVYFSTEDRVSYHLFDDLSAASVLLRPHINATRGTGTVLHSITFHDPSLSYFGLWVARYLVFGATTLETRQNCERMMVLVRRKCMDDGVWDEEAVTRLCMQVGFEVGWRVPEELRELRGVDEH